MKKWLLNKIFVYLFPYVELEKIITSNKQGQLFLNKKQIDAQTLDDLQHEVYLFQNSKLWDIVHNTIKHQAQEIMFTKATSQDDILAGKSMLYTLSIQNNIIKLLDKR